MCTDKPCVINVFSNMIHFKLLIHYSISILNYKFVRWKQFSYIFKIDYKWIIVVVQILHSKQRQLAIYCSNLTVLQKQCRYWQITCKILLEVWSGYHYAGYVRLTSHRYVMNLLYLTISIRLIPKCNIYSTLSDTRYPMYNNYGFFFVY